MNINPCTPPDSNGEPSRVAPDGTPGPGACIQITVPHPLQRAYVVWRAVARKVIAEKAPFAVQCRAGMREQRALKRCIAAGLEVPQ